MSWTEERIERLKAMWTKGATASQIADELGGVSRNAVIGKAHRLGLESRPSPVKPGEEKEKKAKAAPAASAGAPSAEPGRVQATPVRSGQQVYAEQRDLTVLATVGAGAEVIADGSIHIYGALRGRALAGAQGFEQARIFCREFPAELVAIAGHYKVLEDMPAALRGKPVQIWLEKGQLHLAALD